jgi:hypothetical protein
MNLKKAFFGWRRTVVHSKQLEILSENYRESNEITKRRNIFDLWHNKIQSSTRNKYILGSILSGCYLRTLD